MHEIKSLYEFIKSGLFEVREGHETIYQSDFSDDAFPFIFCYPDTRILIRPHPRHSDDAFRFIFCYPDTPSIDSIEDYHSEYIIKSGVLWVNTPSDIGILSFGRTDKEAWESGYELFSKNELTKMDTWLGMLKTHKVERISSTGGLDLSACNYKPPMGTPAYYLIELATNKIVANGETPDILFMEIRSKFIVTGDCNV